MMIRRPSRLSRAGLLVGLMALTAGTSCVDSKEFLIVERGVWWGDSCTMSASDAAIVGMILDVSFDSAYGMGFVVTNNRIPNEGSNTGLDDSEIVLDFAEVNLSFSGGSLAVSSYEYQLPTESLGGGDSVPVLVEIPTDVGESLAATMSALPAGTHETLNMEVVFHARTTGSPGSDARLGAFTTRPFIYPMQICYGCLASCLPASECGGEGETLVCPDSTDYVGHCGYAQGASIVHPSCS